MTTAACEPSADQPRGKKGRVIAALVAGAVLAAGVGYGIWARLPARTPEPPVPDLAGALPDVAQAIQAASASVTANPRSAFAWGHLGMVLQAHDYLAEAQRSYAQAGKLDSCDPRWPYLEAVVRLKDPYDPGPGLPLLKRAVELAGDKPAPRLRLGEALLEQGQLDEAETHFRRVLAGDSQNPRALLGLGEIAHFRGDLKAGQDYLARSARLAPQVMATHALLAEIDHRLGDEKAAENERRRLTQSASDPNWPDPYLQEVQHCATGVLPDISKATDLFQRGRGSEAIKLMQQSVARHPDALLGYLALGRFCNQLGDAAGAERTLREAIRREPDAFEAHFELGLALQIQGRYGPAAECYRRTTALKADYAPAHYRLGHCLVRQGDRSGAVAAFRAAVRYRPNYAAGHKDLGILLAQSGAAAEALSHMQQAVRLNPADPQARTFLARLVAHVPIPVGP